MIRGLRLKRIWTLISGVTLTIVGVAFLIDIVLFLPVFLGVRYEWEIPLYRYLLVTFVSLPLTIIGLIGGLSLLRKWYLENYRKTA